MDNRRSEVIRYRIQQAEEALHHANVLIDVKGFAAAVNRAYYAMFYSVLALLVTRNLGTSKHSGAIALFDREFRKSGIFSDELSKWLHRAFDIRQESDYREMVSVTESTAKEILAYAQVFVSKVKLHLCDQGFIRCYTEKDWERNVYN